MSAICLLFSSDNHVQPTWYGTVIMIANMHKTNKRTKGKRKKIYVTFFRQH